ncbi:Triacylglycerol lipase [Bertholletia excelsa]
MASEESGFSKNYLHLRHEKAGFLDLINLLFYRKSKAEGVKFLDRPVQRKEEELEYRWVVFISIMLQKLLKAVEKPLAWIGDLVETWLNLSAYSNFFVFLWNFLQGKVKADKDSPTFLSIIGNLDKRVELDKSIRHKDVRYNSALSMMAAKASYENRAYIESVVTNRWKMEFLGSFDFWNEYQEKATTQAFMLRDPESELILVAFRGTETFDADAWSTDCDFSWYELHGMGKAHFGFLKALGLQPKTGWPKDLPTQQNRSLAYYHLRSHLKTILKENHRARVLITGHSLGGALAVLFPALLAFHGEEEVLERVEGVYTFGQPRVGDKEFGKCMEGVFRKFGIPYHRFVYCNDIVPRLPYDSSAFLFKHFGTCLYYNSFYQGKVVKEEPNKNYFSPLWAIPKIINAVWELVRSFIMPYMKGPEYKESSALLVLRFLGLVIAGIPAHSPQEYGNCTRLGSPDVYHPDTSSPNFHQT